MHSIETSFIIYRFNFVSVCFICCISPCTRCDTYTNTHTHTRPRTPSQWSICANRFEYHRRRYQLRLCFDENKEKGSWQQRDAKMAINHLTLFCFTFIRQQTLNPVWNEEFIFKVKAAEHKLVLQVFDENRLTRDDFLGMVEIPLANLPKESESRAIPPKSYPLRPRRSVGYVLLFVSIASFLCCAFVTIRFSLVIVHTFNIEIIIELFRSFAQLFQCSITCSWNTRSLSCIHPGFGRVRYLIVSELGTRLGNRHRRWIRTRWRTRSACPGNCEGSFVWHAIDWKMDFLFCRRRMV